MTGSSLPPALEILPPLVNSANPWATGLEDLQALYECPSTGAVTTRTSLIKGFAHDPSRHQYTLFDATTHRSEQDHNKLNANENASLNTLGYSPFTLDKYLDFIKTIAKKPSSTQPRKGFIISVTGSPEDVVQCYGRIGFTQTQVPFPLAMEVNLSCPNIPHAEPPAYNSESLLKYLAALQQETSTSSLPRIPFGLKTPPYTRSSEYAVLISALGGSAANDASGVCPVSFITATNTLGSCLILADPEAGTTREALPTPGIGGMAGAPLHPLALGNVSTIRKLLDKESAALGHIQVIGVGGVLDASGFKRMKAVGATFVGVGTGLGIYGVKVLEDIEKGL